MNALRRRLLMLVAFGLVLGGLLVPTAGPADDKEPVRDKKKVDLFADLIGKPAPELIGERISTGNQARLSDFKGKVVLVDFWAVWCGPCLRVFPTLKEWRKEYKDQGFEVVGVTSYHKIYGFDKDKGRLKLVAKKMEDEDTGKVTFSGGLEPPEERAMLQEFTAFHKVSHPQIVLTSAAWKTAAGDYNFIGIPTSVLIDRRGIIRMAKSGAHPDILEEIGQGIKKLIEEK